MSHYDSSWLDIQDALNGIPMWSQMVQEVASVTEGIVAPDPNPSAVIIGAQNISPVNGLDGRDLVKGGAALSTKQALPAKQVLPTETVTPAKHPPLAEQSPQMKQASQATQPTQPTQATQPSVSAQSDTMPDVATSSTVKDASVPNSADSGPSKVEDTAEVKKEISKNEISGNIFSYMYIMFALITICAAMSMVFFAWFDVRKLSQYVPSARASDKVLMFVDTMEHRILKQDPQFNVFIEHLGPINIIMSMGVHMLSILLLQVILGILVKIALNGGDISDVFKAFHNPWFKFVMALFMFTLIVVLVYYFQFNRNRFNKDVVGGVFERKLATMEDLHRHIKRNIYDAPDNIAFYQRLTSSVRDHGRAFRDYLSQQASIPRSQKDIAKMMFTFNLFNYYFNQFNTVENFMATPIFKYFDGLPVNFPSFNPVFYINVLTMDASNGIANVFDASIARSYYNRTASNKDRNIGINKNKLWENNHTLIEMMSVLNANLSTMRDFNWRSGGTPSDIYMTFKHFLRDRLIFWCAITAAIIALVAVMIWHASLSGFVGGIMSKAKGFFKQS